MAQSSEAKAVAETKVYTNVIIYIYIHTCMHTYCMHICIYVGLTREARARAKDIFGDNGAKLGGEGAGEDQGRYIHRALPP